MKERIESKIQEALEGAEVHVLDPMNDGVHLEAIVIHSSFEGLPLVKQHKLVMQALKEDFDSTELHALGLKTMTPEKWAAQKG